MNPSEFRVGIVGFGRIAETHLEAWNASENTKVVAACDSAEQSLEKAKLLGLAAYTDVAEMIAGEKLDAVSICSPPAYHLPQAAACLEAGVPVLCEKPVGNDLESAQNLLSIAARTRTPFQLATKFRHVPEIRKARDLILHGVIGDAVTFQVEFAGAVDMSNRWNSRQQLSGGGVLIDNGCHAVDTVRFLLSGISRIQGVSLRNVQGLPVEDSALMLATTECGATGRILLSWSMKSWRDTYLTVQGTRGMIEIGWKQSFLHVEGEAPVQIGNGYSKAGAHKRMAGMFRDMIVNNEEGWITPADVMASATVIEAAYRSMQTSRWARVPQLPIERPAFGAAAASGD